MDIYHVIKRPLVTEKGTHQSRQSHEATHSRPGRGGAYSFEVHPDANKAQVRDAVQKLYGVKVLDVRTSNKQGKLRRYRLRTGRTRQTKRAVVVVDPNSHIDLF